MTIAEPRVAVVLLNWNNAGDTVACVETLRRSTYANIELIVIDNGSTDDSMSRLRPLAGGNDLVLIETGANLGFPAACNLGARRGLADGAEYVFLLNNDTEIAPDAIEYLVCLAESDPRIGLVTPKIMYFEPAGLVWYGGAQFDDRFLAGRQAGYRLYDHGEYEQETDVPWATGCAMLIRRSVIEAAGLLQEDYFFGTEDLDYSLRVRQAGYRIRYMPRALVWHKEAAAAGGRDVPQYVYYQVRNVLLLRRLWATGVTGRLTAIGYSWAWIAKRSLNYAVEGKWCCVLATMYGISDHLRRAYGRREHPLIARKRTVVSR